MIKTGCGFFVSILLAVTLPSSAVAQSRIDFHLLPAVSTGPLDPDWSPDMQSLVYAARGDIWRIPADGGRALALTSGSAYHSEPAFSPDGRRVALTMYIDGTLNIAIVDAASGPIQRITDSPEQEFSPEWSADGRSLYFVRRQNGSLDILNVVLETGEVSEVVAGPGNAYQPAISPDGLSIAYVAPVENRIGSGGIWVRSVGEDNPRLVHYEESSYRLKPQWSADGNSIFYISDAAGSNDIAAVPLEGGNRVRLTHEGYDEFDPAISPDGTRIAFVANEHGPTVLHTVATAGGARNSWRQVRINARSPQFRTGLIRGRILDERGQTTPARLMLTASDGRSYTEDGGFHRMVPSTQTHFQHSDGTFAIEVPAGKVTLEVMRGFEYRPTSVQVDVQDGGVVDTEISLERIDNPAARGWHSGDMHVHDLHEGRYGLTHEMYFRQLAADDVGIANSLIHMDGTKIMGRWNDLTGDIHPVSDSKTILRYSQEFRGYFGHIALVGVNRFIMPMIAGTPNTPYAPDTLGIRHADGVHSQGGIAGFVHPYNHAVNSASDAGRSGIPVVAAIAAVDFYDVTSSASIELDSATVYYKLLNSGIRLAATGGTDNFSDVWFDPSGGATRTYAHTQPGRQLNYDEWLAAVAAGKTFSTSGPLLFLSVNGRIPGDEINLGEGQSTTLNVDVQARSIAPLEYIEIIANGEIVHRWDIDASAPLRSFSTTVDLSSGGWIAARAVGPQSRYVGDAFAFAHTSPVYVVQEGRDFTSAADAEFLLQAVDELWQNAINRNTWATDTQRETFHAQVNKARKYYRDIILADPQHETFQATAPDNFQVDLRTTEGLISVDVRREWAPVGVDRFYNLVLNGYFDDSYFFRVRDAEFTQFGVHGNPRIATAWRHQVIPDDPVIESNLRGTVAFAMGNEPNDRTTQVYINLKDKPELDEMGFAIIGKVTSGMDVADALHSGYGESAGGGIRNGKQDILFERGNEYLEESFADLDRIIEATIIVQ